MVNEIRELGFEWIELSHGLPASMLPGVLEAVKAGEIRVAGAHNFLPSPVEVRMDAPDIYEVTSHRPVERRRAMELSRRSLDMAARFGAKYLVMHMGSVPAMKSWRWTRRMEQLAAEGERGGEEYDRVQEEFARRRKRQGVLPWRRAQAALAALRGQARELGIVLAVESRSHGEQVPSEDELYGMFPETAEDWDSREEGYGYWHDFGHVQRKHNLMKLDHVEYFRRMLPFLVGCHVHDVEYPERDHRVPFRGEVAFHEMIPLIPEDKPLTWEISPRQRSEYLRDALAEWRVRFG